MGAVPRTPPPPREPMSREQKIVLISRVTRSVLVAAWGIAAIVAIIAAGGGQVPSSVIQGLFAILSFATALTWHVGRGSPRKQKHEPPYPIETYNEADLFWLSKIGGLEWAEPEPPPVKRTPPTPPPPPKATAVKPPKGGSGQSRRRTAEPKKSFTGSVVAHVVAAEKTLGEQVSRRVNVVQTEGVGFKSGQESRRNPAGATIDPTEYDSVVEAFTGVAKVDIPRVSLLLDVYDSINRMNEIPRLNKSGPGLKATPNNPALKRRPKSMYDSVEAPSPISYD
ncbi:hypothetical protein KHQ84_gp145 [Rhodococcus phage Finch]|uniref:Uncharacterized protein n=1 Tax=Rhodococcus phage Finch TaxID=2094144 RepID=A0A2P1JXL2_9CAUD|nr:hypothetical protein KHQ84_gp145 [Rhodococcus phage Finch]AVO25075.1 hypothetical protein SEA_FINCH_145 [Rhodococcus phage Finch]